MTSTNNLVMRRQLFEEEQPVYGLRKLSVGVGSVLLGTLMFAGVNNVAHADTVSPATGSQPAASTTVSQPSVASSAVINQTPTAPVSQTNPMAPANNVNPQANNSAVTNNTPISAASNQATVPTANLNQYQVTTNDQQNYQIGFKPNQTYSGSVTLPNTADVQAQYPQAQQATFSTQSLNHADVSQVTNLQVSNRQGQQLQVSDLHPQFNQLTGVQHLDLRQLDMNKVKNLNNSLSNLPKLETVNVSDWQTKQVVDTKEMFANNPNLKQIHGLNSLDLQNTRTMQGMFKNTPALKQANLSQVKTSSKLTDTTAMFENSGVKSVNLTNLQSSQVTDMSKMFKNTPNLQAIKGLNQENTASVKNASDMFNGAGLANVDLDHLNGEKITNMHGMLSNMANLRTITGMRGFGYRNSADGTSKVTDLSAVVKNDPKLTNVDLVGFTNTKNLTNLKDAFNNTNLSQLDLSPLKVEKTKDLSGLAANNPNLQTVAFGKDFDVKNADNASEMLANNYSLRALDLSNVKLNSTAKTDNMFANDVNLKSLSGLNQVGGDLGSTLAGLNSETKNQALTNARLYGVSTVDDNNRDYTIFYNFVDQNGDIVSSMKVGGSTGYHFDADSDPRMKAELNDLIKDGYTLISGQTIPSATVTGQTQTFTIHVQGNGSSTAPAQPEASHWLIWQILDQDGNVIASERYEGPAGTLISAGEIKDDVQRKLSEGYTLDANQPQLVDTVIGDSDQTISIHMHAAAQAEHSKVTWIAYDENNKKLGSADFEGPIGGAVDLSNLESLINDLQKEGWTLKTGQSINQVTVTKDPQTFKLYFTNDSASDQTIDQVIQLVDDDYQDGMTDKDGNPLKRVAAEYTVSGKPTDAVAVNVSSHVPEGYQLAPNKTIPNTVNPSSTPVVIHLIHQTSQQSVTKSYTRHLEYINDSAEDVNSQLLGSNDQSASVTYTERVDQLTGKSTIVDFPDAHFDSMTAPDMSKSGMELTDPNKKTIPATKITQDTPVESNYEVHYHEVSSDPQGVVKVHLEYVDMDDRGGHDFGNGADIATKPGTKINLQQYLNKDAINFTPDLKMNAMNGDQLADYLVTNVDHQTVKIYLRHKTESTTEQRTVHRLIYGVVSGQSTRVLLADQTASSSRQHVHDLVSSAMDHDTDWSNISFDRVDLSNNDKLNGLTPSPSVVNQLNLSGEQVGALEKDNQGNYAVSPVLVTLSENSSGQTDQDVAVNIQFVDADNNNSPVGPVIAKTAKQGTSSQLDSLGIKIPANYQLADEQLATVNFDQNKSMTVKLVHQKIDLSNNPALAGLLHKTVTRTIKFVDENGNQVADPIVQTAAFSRTAYIDKVLGKQVTSPWTYDHNQSSDKTKAQFDQINLPQVAGYHADEDQSVPVVDLTKVNTDLPSNSTITITYQKNTSHPDNPGKPSGQDQMMVSLVDLDLPNHPYVGKTITVYGTKGQSTDLSSQVTIPDNYELADPKILTVDFDSTQNLVVGLCHKKTTTQAAKKIQRVIIFKDSDQGSVPADGYQEAKQDSIDLTQLSKDSLAKPIVLETTIPVVITRDLVTNKTTITANGKGSFDEQVGADLLKQAGLDRQYQLVKSDLQLNELENLDGTTNFVDTIYVKNKNADASQVNKLHFVLADDDDSTAEINGITFGANDYQLPDDFDKDQLNDFIDKTLQNSSFGVMTALQTWLSHNDGYALNEKQPITWNDGKNNTAQVLIHLNHRYQTRQVQGKATWLLQYNDGHGMDLGADVNRELPVTLEVTKDLVTGEEKITKVTPTGDIKSFPGYNIGSTVTSQFPNKEITAISVSDPKLMGDVTTDHPVVGELTPTANDYQFQIVVSLGDKSAQPVDTQHVWKFVDNDQANQQIADVVTSEGDAQLRLNDLVKQGYQLVNHYDQTSQQDGQTMIITTINLKHRVVEETKNGQATLVVHFVDQDDHQMDHDLTKTVTVPVKYQTDLVTKQTRPVEGQNQLGTFPEVKVAKAGYLAILNIDQNPTDNQQLARLNNQQITEIPSLQLLASPDNLKTELTVKYQKESADMITKTLEFVDDQGKTVGNQTVSGKAQNKLDVTYQLPAGYQTENHAVGMTITFDQPGTIKIPVVKASGDQDQMVTKVVNYVNENGQSVGQQTLTGKQGSQQTIDYQVPAGYQLTDPQTTRQITFDQSGTILVHVKADQPTQATIEKILNFVDPTGKIVGFQKVQGILASKSTVDLKLPRGYQMTDGSTTASIDFKDDSAVKLDVMAINQTMTKQVLFETDNGTIVGRQAITGKVKEPRKVSLQVPKGYHLLNPQETQFTDPMTNNHDVVIKVLENQNTPQVVNSQIIFTDDQGKTQGKTVGQQTVSGLEGHQGQVNLQVPTGYQLADNSHDDANLITYGQNKVIRVKPVKADSSNEPVNNQVSNGSHQSVGNLGTAGQQANISGINNGASDSMPVATVEPIGNNGGRLIQNTNNGVAGNDATTGQLPQTGNQMKNQLAILGLGLMSITLGLGLLNKQRNN